MGTGGHSPGMFPLINPGGFQGGHMGGPPPYHAPPPMMNGGYNQNGGYSIPTCPPGMPPALVQMHRPQYSNVVKYYANWNACYSCGFDVLNNHTSMMCPTILQKVSHHIGFNHPNAQQYIDLGHPCCMNNRHKTQFPANMWRSGAVNRNVAFKCIDSFYVNTNNSSYPDLTFRSS